MNSSFHYLPTNYQIRSTPAQNGSYNNQRGSNHETNIEINHLERDETHRVEIDPHNNDRPIWLNSRSRSFIPHHNTNYPIYSSDSLPKQQFQDSNNLNYQNPQIRHTYAFPYQHIDNLNCPYQKGTYHSNNQITISGQNQSSLPANQSYFNLNNNFHSSYLYTNFQPSYPSYYTNSSLNRQLRFQNYGMSDQDRMNNIRPKERQQFNFHNNFDNPPTNLSNYGNKNCPRQISNAQYKEKYQPLGLATQNWRRDKQRYEWDQYGNENKTKPHSNVKNLLLTMGSNDLTQKGEPVVYFDASETLVQKSHVQLLLQEIQQLNNEMEGYIGEIDEAVQNRSRQITNYEGLREKVAILKQVIECNYKIIEQSVSQGAQKSQQDYKRQNYQRQYKKKTNFDKYQLIDLQEEFNRLLQINQFYAGSPQQQFNETNQSQMNFDQQALQCNPYFTEINQKNPEKKLESNQKSMSNKQDEAEESLSSEFCISVFLKLFCAITQFYHLNHIIPKVQRKLSRTKMVLGKQQQKQSPPLVIVNILCHIQTIRLLLKSYQHQLIQSLSVSVGIQNLSAGSGKKQNGKVLESIKLKWLDLWNEVQDLMVQFLEEIMISPQHLEGSTPKQDQNTHQTTWFFYYEYPSFNRNWINDLLDTLLQTQMLTDINQNINHTQAIINQPKQHKTKPPHHLNKKSNHYSPQTAKNNSEIHQQQQTHHLNPQVENNLLSIISFLLHPHTYNIENVESNSISNLLESPIKQLTVRQIKAHQNKAIKLNGDIEKIEWIKKTILSKFLMIEKVSSIFSFYTSKLSSSKSTPIPKSHKKYHPIIGPHSNLQASQLNFNSEFSKTFRTTDKNLNSQTFCVTDTFDNESKGIKSVFSVELKVMELTLFVRQMADILLDDSYKTLSQKTPTQDNAISKAQLQLNWAIKGFSIQRVLSSFFEKIFKRKKRQP